ncbi:MAG: sortase [Ruminococcaceae bacterium]|nr:sortase [Oscillospiraceae bacterium]
MKKRKFPIVLVLGISLVVISFSLIVGLQIRTHIGANENRKVVTRMNEILPERTVGVPGLYPNPNMPVLEINDVDYVALIEIPSLNLTLPVADAWNSQKLYISPARFYGSCYDHSLVIGGTDNSHQFSFCDKIDNGTVIIVTDMTGTQFSYTVSRVDRSKSAKSNWLVNGDYDLTLFCRDTYSMEYVAVRCSFMYS